MLSPLSLLRGLGRTPSPNGRYTEPIETTRIAVAEDFKERMDPGKPIALGRKSPKQPVVDKTFSYCFGCQTCTTVCPVVNTYENAQEVLGLLPHQIMCAVGLGEDAMASGARMIWDCLTCYQCQEHCPQNVRVADVLYGLKNLAVKTCKNNDPEPESGHSARSVRVKD